MGGKIDVKPPVCGLVNPDALAAGTTGIKSVTAFEGNHGIHAVVGNYYIYDPCAYLGCQEAFGRCEPDLEIDHGVDIENKVRFKFIVVFFRDSLRRLLRGSGHRGTLGGFWGVGVRQ
jgi:hypothetical protein